MSAVLLASMPMWDVPRRRVGTAGFGLLEMILTFILVIGAGAGVFWLYQSAKATSDAETAVDQASTIASGLQQVLGGKAAGYSGLTTTRAIDAHVIPRDMVNADGTTAQGPWGALSVNGNFLIGSRFGYQITFQEVPASACVKMTAMATKRFVGGYVLINNQAAINADGQVASNGDLDVNWAAFACKDINTVSLVGI